MLLPMCVRADLAASMRSRWERGLGVQDFIPWLSYPCSAKIHTSGLPGFFCFFCGFFMEQKIHWAEMNWISAPQRMDSASLGSFWWNGTSQALVWKQRRFL